MPLDSHPPNTLTLDFSSSKLWNRFYVPLLNDTSEFLHLYGSAGSGKSRFAAQKEVVKSFEARRKNRNTLVIRKVATTLKNSVYAELKNIITKWGLQEYFHFQKSPLCIVNLVTGVTFIFIGLDDVEKVKSISDVDRIWIEEATELINRNELDQLRLRLRGFEEVQITLSYNPINEHHWLNTEIHEVRPDGHKLVHSTYLHNEKLLKKDPVYADSIERYKETNPNYYRVYGLGLWGRNSEGLIYPDYEIVSEMPDAQFYGIDPGFSDPTAVIAGCVKDNVGKRDLFVQEIVYKPHLNSADLIQLIGHLSKSRPMIVDSSRPELIEDLKRAGFNARPSKKYAGSVLDGINEVKNHNLKIVAGSRNLVRELQNYSWQEKNGAFVDKPAEGIEHLCDAFRYGLESRMVQQWSMERRPSR